MNNSAIKTIAIYAALAALMAATRFDHFGSAVAVPDASLAVFFLGGLYLARAGRAALMVFTALILEAGLIDYYATSVQGISDWCMTPAYWFLIPTYAGLWLAGHWFASRYTRQGHSMSGLRLFQLALLAWVACSLAFVFSNVTFYLFSERFTDMSAVEYAARVAQYYGSYVAMALLYIFCAVALQMAFTIIAKQMRADAA